MNKFLEQLKEYGGVGFLVLASLLASAISYGGVQAATTSKLNELDSRVNIVEIDNKQYGKDIAAIKQHVDDLWHDAGHKER